MADLSKIKIPNGTEYNLKDAQARADIESLNGLIYSLTEQVNYKKGLQEDGYFHIQPAWFSGLYVNPSGAELQSSVWVCSAFIGVDENDIITYSGERIDDVSFFIMILTYDSNKNFVSRIQNTPTQNNPYVVPENVKYIRFNLGYSASQGMNRHPEIKLFDAYFNNSYINDVIVPKITDVQEKTDDLVFHVIGDEPNVEWENGTLDSKGRNYPNDNYARTDFLKTGKSVTVDNPNEYFLYICLFDSNKQNIISLTRFYGEFETNEADYFRICVRTESGTTGIDSVSIHVNGVDNEIEELNNEIEELNNEIEELNNTINEANEKVNNLYIDNCITMLFATFKRFGVIGDSMAAGHLYPNPSTSANNYDDKQYAWGTFLTRFLGTTYYNFSQHGHDPKTFIEGKFPIWDSAGTTITGYTTVEDGNNFSTVIDGNHDVPLMFIAVGINNKFKLEMGSISDIDVNNPDNNANTRYGWYAKLVQKVSDYYANKNQPLIMVMLTFPFFSNASVTERYAPLVRDVYSTLKNPIEQNTNNRLMLIDLQADNSLYVSDFMMAQTIQNHYAGIGYNVAGMDLLRRLNRFIYNNPNMFERVDQIESNILITQYDNPENFT